MKRPNDWRFWFEAADVAPGRLREDYRLGNSSLAYQAAIDGLGIAMAHVELIQDDLNAGRLIAVYPLVVRTADNYHLVGREADSDRAEIAAFRDWLLSETKIDRTKANNAPASVPLESDIDSPISI